MWNWARDGDFEDRCGLLDFGLLDDDEDEADARYREVARRRRGREEALLAEHEAALRALRDAGCAQTEDACGDAPREILLSAMTERIPQMSAPAREAVERAGCWWRDSGRAAEGYSEGKYTVDAWGRRRGASRKHGCAWYRRGLDKNNNNNNDK